MSAIKRVYLDHAATTPVRTEVMDAMLPIFQDHFGNPSSFYHRGQEAKRLLEDARQRIATCIQAQVHEIYFTSCGTESDNWGDQGCCAGPGEEGSPHHHFQD